jgi:hypothetical protein
MMTTVVGSKIPRHPLRRQDSSIYEMNPLNGFSSCTSRLFYVAPGSGSWVSWIAKDCQGLGLRF